MPQEHNRGTGSPRRMRIAIDIDSTLHHYWDELADSAKRRFGVELPYEQQHTWRISRCAELDIDVLIDDSPITLARALEHGMVAATLAHPWNRELCEEEADVVCADDWPGLAAALELRLPQLRHAA